MRSFHETRKRWNIVFPVDAVGVDLRQAVKDSDSISPCEDGLRSICWKAFLLYGPISQTSWPKKLVESRSAYTSLRDHFLRYILHPDDLHSAVDPLADDEHSPWSSLRQDEASRQEIFQDVERCMQDNFFFREPSTKQKMLDILFIYSKLNPDTGYRQGMHEILGPILWVIECDALDSASLPTAYHSRSETMELMRTALDFDYVEHDSFNMFCAVMQTTKSFYEMSPNKESSPIVARCHRIHDDILALVDPDLAHHLQSINVLPQVYIIRWVRLLFGREFAFDDVLRIWDLLFAGNISPGLIDMICVAMLLRVRWELMEADYSTALNLLLRYSLPRSPPEKPVNLVKDAFYLDRERTPQAAAQLVFHYSGKSPIASEERRRKDVRASIESRPARPFVPGPQKSTKSAPRPVSASSVGQPSPGRFSPQQKGLESLFHEVSGNLQKRTEGWNLSKTVLGAVNEVKRNMNNSITGSPQRSRVATVIAAGSLNESSEVLPNNEAIVGRIYELEERNKALATMLDSALDSLRSVKFEDPDSKAIAEDAFNISLAKIQFVSVYLSDPEIPIPPDDPTTSQLDGSSTLEEQDSFAEKDRGTASSMAEQASEMSSKAVVPAVRLDPAPDSTPKMKVAPQTQRHSQQRPSLAESSFSFMLGEGRHRSSFVSGVAALPEQSRVEQLRETEKRSRSSKIVIESKRQHREHRGSDSEDDGFTLTSLQVATNEI